MISKSEIKYLNSLKHKKYREIHSEFLIEGQRIISSALEIDNSIKAVFFTERFKNSSTFKSVLEQIKKNCIPVKIVDEKTMNKITDTENPSGISAVCSLPKLKSSLNDFTGPGLFLDSISDPGNMGTICRTAAWFGVTNIVISQDCVDPFNLKVVRGGMGAHFHLNFYRIPLKTLSEKNYEIIGADFSGISLNDFKQKNENKWILVLGSEAHGISEDNRKYLDETISIPKYGEGDSLNVAVSAGVLLSSLACAGTKS